MAVPIAGLGIVIRPHEVGLTCPGVLPIHQCTFPYGHHSVSHHVGYHYPLITERVVRTGLEPVLFLVLWTSELLPITPPDYLITLI